VETLKHIIIYNPVFSLVNNCYIYNPCCMMSTVHMATLHLNLNYICNKLFFCYFLNPINTQKPPNLTLTHLGWNKIIIKKKHWLYCFLPSMNQFRFMEIQYICQLFCLICFTKHSSPIFNIPCHLQLSCICKTNESNILL
jgi:hypothetical protein